MPAPDISCLLIETPGFALLGGQSEIEKIPRPETSFWLATSQLTAEMTIAFAVLAPLVVV